MGQTETADTIYLLLIGLSTLLSAAFVTRYVPLNPAAVKTRQDIRGRVASCLDDFSSFVDKTNDEGGFHYLLLRR